VSTRARHPCSLGSRVPGTQGAPGPVLGTPGPVPAFGPVLGPQDGPRESRSHSRVILTFWGPFPGTLALAPRTPEPVSGSPRLVGVGPRGPIFSSLPLLRIETLRLQGGDRERPLRGNPAPSQPCGPGTGPAANDFSWWILVPWAVQGSPERLPELLDYLVRVRCNQSSRRRLLSG
jgi:hypothetical protein